MINAVKYELIPATEDNINILIKYKYKTIFEFADNLQEQEIIKIKNYITNNVPELIKDYKLILINNNIAGCILYYKKDDGILLDEIFIEEKYRNYGIGTNLITNILKNYEVVYLWVYKLNINAIKLYKRLGFEVIDETKTRYYMMYNINKWN